MTITLATLPQATEQQVFDQVARHLLTQNAKSMSGDNLTCAYRGKDNTMCAAGCLISDEEMERLRDMNTTDWSELVEFEVAPLEHRGLIKELQSVHDLREPVDWPLGLRQVAYHRRLSIDVVAEFA